MTQHKRRIYLINPGFQFKYALLVCLFVIIATIVYPWTILDIFQSLKQYVQPGIDIEAQRNELILLLFIIEFVILLITCIIMLFLTHRVAGPMYKLTQTIKSIKAGSLLKKVYFRKGDNFHEVAHVYNDAVDIINSQISYSKRELEEVLSNLKSVRANVPEIKESIIKLELMLQVQNNQESEIKVD